jgi:hypothetical protein
VQESSGLAGAAPGTSFRFRAVGALYRGRNCILVGISSSSAGMAGFLRLQYETSLEWTKNGNDCMAGAGSSTDGCCGTRGDVVVASRSSWGERSDA